MSGAAWTRESVLAAIGNAQTRGSPGVVVEDLWGQSAHDVYKEAVVFDKNAPGGRRYDLRGVWVCDGELDALARHLNEVGTPRPVGPETAPPPVPPTRSPRPDVGCPTCHGSGRAARGGPNPCDVCGGKGRLPPAREPDEPRCLASCERPHGTTDHLYCTRPNGHEGAHVGHFGIGADAKALGSWPAETVPPAPAETPRPSVDEPLPLWTRDRVLATLRGATGRHAVAANRVYASFPAASPAGVAYRTTGGRGEKHDIGLGVGIAEGIYESELEAMVAALNAAGTPPPPPAESPRDVFLRALRAALPCEGGSQRPICACKSCVARGAIAAHAREHGADSWAENALAGAKADREARASAKAGTPPIARPNRCCSIAPPGAAAGRRCTLDKGHPAAIGHASHNANGERVHEWSAEAPAPAAPQLCSCDACPTCAARGDRCGMPHPTAVPCMRPSGHDGPHESRRSAGAPALLWSTPTVAFGAHDLYSVEVIAEALDPILRQAVLVGVTPVDKALEVAERALAEYAAETASRCEAAQALALAIERVKEGRAR